jgi:hypothetical protein
VAPARRGRKTGIVPVPILPQTGQDVPPRARPQEKIRLSFEQAQDGGAYCLSLCEKKQVRSAITCLKKFTGHTWVSVFSTGGHGKNSGGLGYEQHPNPKLLGQPLPAAVPLGAKLFSIRASLGFRIFGFRADGIAHIFWFDPKHDILP